jgi:MerR family transcriptional regulator, copper efflux regulator
MSTMLQISQVANQTGKTTRTLRFYEELGILKPEARTDSGYRLYSEDSILRIEWIDKLQEIGFSLPEIQSFVESFSSIDLGPDMMKGIRKLYQQKLMETNAKILRLQALETELTASIQYIDACHKCEPSTSSTLCKGCKRNLDENSPMLISVISNSV